MAFSTDGFAYCGESQDKDIEIISSIIDTAQIAVTHSTTFAQTGSRCLAFDLTTNGNRATVVSKLSSWNLLTRIVAVSMGIGLSGTPSSELCFLQATTTDYGDTGDHKVLRIGTDRKIYVYDNDGTQVAVSTNTIPTSGSMREVCVIFDALTCHRLFIHVWMDGALELSVDTGQTPTEFWGGTKRLIYGEYLAGGTNRGVTLYMDDLYTAESSTPGDAPHLTPYPRIRVNGSFNHGPDAEGAHTAFSGTHAEIDSSELPENDGTTTEALSAVGSTKQTWKSSTANIFPNPCVIVKVQLRSVMRSTGGTKVTGKGLLRLGGTDTSALLVWQEPNSSTTYAGAIVIDCDRPGGGSFSRSDFNANTLEYGFHNDLASDVGTACTLFPGPEVVFYDDDLPLATAPACGGGRTYVLQQ